MVRVEDCRAGMPGSVSPRHMEETCTLTKFVEQKLSLCVKKLRNFMLVYANRKGAV